MYNSSLGFLDKRNDAMEKYLQTVQKGEEQKMKKMFIIFTNIN